MLTKAEEKVLHYISRHIATHGRAPTRAIIADALGCKSRGSAERHIKALETKGHLFRDRQWGGLRLAGESEKRATILPLVGRISAGKPIEAIPDLDEINIPEMLLGPDRYVLKVQGDSMIDAGIQNGDFVVIKHAATARSGDIVVALIDGTEASLKRYKKKQGGVELIPENTTMSPAFYEKDRVQIQGIVVGQFRVYK